MDEEPIEAVTRRPVKRLIALGLLGILLLALIGLWTQRRPIASDFIEDELARRGVQATYEVTRIGFRTQRLENLVIGDPRNPDLTARWVEVRLSWGFRRPKVSLITARGIRLNARLADGRIGMGQVDRLLPPPSGLPFRFPDQAVDIADASVRFDTPAGRIGLALEGRGNLSDGFRGRMAAASRGLSLGSCGLQGVSGRWNVAIDDLKPRFRGPARAASLACGDNVAIAGFGLDVDATLAQALDAWRGQAGVRAAQVRIDRNVVRGLSGRVGFEGDAKDMNGALALASSGLQVGGVSAARGVFDGRYALSLDSGAVSLLGDMSAGGASTGALSGLAEALSSAGGTPVEPIGDALAAAVLRAQRGFDGEASLRLATGRGYGGVRFERIAIASRSGARASLGGGRGLTYYMKGGQARLDGAFALSGGGFPAVRLSLSQPGLGGPVTGRGTVQAMRAGSARLALGNIGFTAAPGGTTRIETVATIDGPIDDGHVEGLLLPIVGRFDGGGGFVFGERCTPVRFRSLRLNTLRLGPTLLPFCPTGRALVWKAPGGSVQGGAQLVSPRFAGTLGASPLNVASNRLRFNVAGPSFTSSGITVRLGSGAAVNALDIDSFSGDFGARGGVAGRYSGLTAKLAAVPLRMTEGAGTWRVRAGDLFLLGSLRVADVAEPPRFWPLISRDFELTLADNRIRAGGWLTDPETGTRIVQADIAHDLTTGRGRAELDVPGIRFGKDYQPEQLTRLTTGIIALVDGILKGRGEIAWDGAGTRSSGTFSIADADFATTFGPVEGFATTLNFTDLLGLATAPGQLAEVGVVRTGIDVFDGRLRYQLLPGMKVKVEGGRWPFAGGELLLDETLLDFSQEAPRLLTFRVVGLDAALFVQKMEFSNIAATGTFDGVIPMIFDKAGGRIEGGYLIAREEGGTLSYIGELTDKDLGAYGKLAFDALKSLRYNKLTISLNGSLGGEFVAGIELDGVARDPVLTSSPSGGMQGMIVGRALAQLRKIPFEFNIMVKGPFRTLLATMRSLEDPTNLIQSALPERLRAPPVIPPVQPQESEIVQ